MQRPPLLKTGDRLRVIAPSGALKGHTNFKKGVEIWRSQGYIIDLGEQYSEKEGYLAGKDEIRKNALQEAWQDPECKAILCARGGYGSTRILEQWQWLDGTPKWIIGFSDITALLWSLAQKNIMGVHGALLTTLADEPSWSQERLFSYLKTGKIEPLKGQGWGNGKATGRLLPANLTVATYLLKTSHQPDLDRVILAFEDISEAPYRIDRMLTFWRTLGCFERVSGIVLGRFSHCDPPVGSQSWTVEKVLCDRLGDLGIPIVSGLPFGHDGVNACLPSGIMAELDGDKGILGF
ncbi:MAG: LD-carboxypeptidase [Microcystaceae cyanobacterium]